MQKVQINIFFIDDLLTLDVGTAMYMVAQDSKFTTDGIKHEVQLKIYPNGGTVSVGKILANVYIQDMYAEEGITTHNSSTKRTTAEHGQNNANHNFAVPGFKFKRLSRLLHWERIRSINISQYVYNLYVVCLALDFILLLYLTFCCCYCFVTTV